jgi:hypothetical protein
MAQHIFDYAIIGSGLTGLCIATALNRETNNIALIDSADVPGGVNRKINFPTGVINNGLRCIPDSILAEKGIRFLENLLERTVQSKISEEAPITYESGNFKTFLGFGDNPPAFYEELNYFTANKKIELDLQPHDWTEILFEKFTGNFMPRSYVTKFHQEGNLVTHITINGSKTIHAHNFIFTGTVKDLALLLPEEALSIRARSKLSKNIYWTSISLDICHSKKMTDSTAMHVLNGTTQDDIGPCIGRFLPAQEVDGVLQQSSQWLTFIESESTEDSEAIGLSLKKMKRQIKRAYPAALDHIKIERIFISPIISGNGDLKVSGNLSLPNLQNLWIASPTMNDSKNLVGSLLQSEMILSALGFKLDQPTKQPEHFEETVAEALL